MPLNKSLRDEEKERINAVLKKLIELMSATHFVKESVDEQLMNLGLNIDTLLQFSGDELIQHLGKLNFDWESLEQFADYLVGLGEKLVSEKANLTEKTLFIYHYIHSESKVFSFGIYGKIAATKAKV
jgi:hypothetical protein